MDILTSEELSELLRIPHSRVVLMAQRGELPSIRVLGKLRFDADEIERWLKSNRPGVAMEQRGDIPRAIFEWPNGLSDAPVIKPIGNIETSAILRALQKLLRAAPQSQGS